jgi:hypothetical protein
VERGITKGRTDVGKRKLIQMRGDKDTKAIRE